MTNINGKGQYYYNLQSGQTIGKRRENKTDDGAEYSKQVVCDCVERYINDTRNDFTLLKSFVDSNSKDVNSCDFYYSHGSVEDLSFNQIVNLFLEGNMIVSELEAGLKAKNVQNLTVRDENGTTVATFTYQDKSYTLRVATRL